MIRPLLIATALVSCVQPDEPELASAQQQASCPIKTCGNNSPLLGPLTADELNEKGIANTAGIILQGFVGRTTGATSACTAAAPCRIDVRGHRFMVAVPSATATNGYVERTGSSLVGGYILVWQPGDNTASPKMPAGNARIYFRDWHQGTSFWQGSADKIDTYELEWEVPGWGEGQVCGNPPAMVDGEGHTWAYQFDAMFFAGDRYDHDTMTVIATNDVESGDYFNIACSGSATMKLHLNRHTFAGSNSAFNTTKSQRQAMLKMFTGDFCGTGTTYTVHGTKLQWTSNTGIAGPVLQGINSAESFWTEDGAICMDRHRLESSQIPEQAAMGTMIRDGSRAVPPTCRAMPSCTRAHRDNPKTYLRTQSAALP